ncbi:uncharacterized protein LOC115476154 [Microcaecilia unicolor]|uniref:Uncharacterized protein LOC115476154 n=1 Tax=Microcaecilia unicolor TaxID=1415580 RepID=A0A6P7YU93_9AMPH|nr:uncharacterized protein LOC115476154 [Microcaecilia unicolor]XP_030068217.1 uncharacterized protein LOC115476154 [Microcaecilia unicolor]XP_030068219.1 uncharacterized protein LOC115476154 [Microcaecilia unicolor]XP_030068220.1 uncharacterized protein LOC115476154 [Microcaecilia unicolor]XP_030068221.1 uncharacterized protein LOC115476154 [Microcaecilia unicolor]
MVFTMEDIKLLTIILLLWALLSEAASQNLIKNSKEHKMEHQLLINEVNADNPGLDTSEFVELYHTSGQNVTLDGYSLVFYNGKVNTAYKVLNLSGHMTNEKGFFLIGSSTLNPLPSIILPSNTIQNGPDAIALYFGKSTYRENMRVTSDGLVDALVHKSKETDKADVLLTMLTPGRDAFLEDPLFRTTDESIERCLGTNSQWTFQVATPSPGRENHCGSESHLTVVISEVSTVSSPAAFEFVELQGFPSTSIENLVLVLIDGQTKKVYFSMDIYGKTSPDGLFLIGPAQSKIPVDQVFPENSSRPLLQLGPDAVALYLGKSSSFQPGTALSLIGLVDALIYTRGDSTDPELLKILTPGRFIFYENEGFQPGDESMSRCSCCSIVRDPSVYVLSHPTPGQPNQCPSRNFSQSITFCLRVVDCSEWPASQATYEIQTFLSRSLAAECNCDISVGYFRDYNLTCHNSALVFHALLLGNSVPHLASLTDAFARFMEASQDVYVGIKKGQVEKACFQDTSTTSSLSPGGVSAVSVTANGTVLPPPELLLNEVNPDNPGGHEDAEFIELFHPGRRSASLDHYYLVLYNGKNNQAYEVVDLTGHYTNEMGYFLVGSQGMAPKPNITLLANTIQNGGDAVALYYSTTHRYRKGMGVTDEGLVDAMVYRSRASDKAEKLLHVLTPGQDILYEDDSVVTEDESLSRCNSLHPRNHSSYQVTRITPLADNACLFQSTVRPSLTLTPGTSRIVINELGLAHDTNPYEFIELKGPPGSSMNAYTLVLFGDDGKAYNSISLQGSLREEGLFVIGLGRVLTVDQLLPHHHAPAAEYSANAVALYRGTMRDFPVGMTATHRNLVDAVVYTWKSDPELLSVFGAAHFISSKKSRTLSLSRCSCCNLNGTVQFAVSDLTPGTENSCPMKDFAVSLDICLKNLNCSRWNEVHVEEVIQMKRALSRSIDDHCSCDSSEFYLQALDFTCTQTKMEVFGEAWARSLEHQHLVQSWYAKFLSSHHLFLVDGSSLEIDPECATPIGTHDEKKGSFRAWELSLIILAAVLVGVAAATFFLYYLKRRPQHYTTIEMNDQREIISDY